MAPVRVESVPATAPETTADTSATRRDRPRLLLLDGHSLAYRAFYALPVENFSTTTGQHTNAVYGFTAMLINVLRDEQPTHLAVAFDVSRKTFRSEAYSDYKANRSKSPDEFQGQVSLIKEVLNALRVPFVEKDGFEADDIIGTLATQALEDDFDVLICSGDRDSFQLVNDRTTVIYPMRGVSEMKRMTPAAVEEKYGVPPGRYPELAALVGESSDNLPGVPGVGPKTAAKWILTYDGLDQRRQPGRGDQGQGGGEPARAPRRRDPQPPAQRAGLRPRPAAEADRPRACSRGTARRCTRCSTAWSSGCCATGSSRPSSPRRTSTTPASPSTWPGSRPGEVGGWLTDNAHDGKRVGVHVEGSWRAGLGRRADAVVRHGRRHGRPRGRRGGHARGRRGDRVLVR